MTRNDVMRYIKSCMLSILLCGAVHASEVDSPVRQGSYACWYGNLESGDRIHGRRYGDYNYRGERIDWTGDFAASWSFPYGTILEIRHKNKKVQVKVIDRGGHKKPDRHKQPIVCELTSAAFKKLAPLKVGKIKVKIIKLDRDKKL